MIVKLCLCRSVGVRRKFLTATPQTSNEDSYDGYYVAFIVNNLKNTNCTVEITKMRAKQIKT
jgi:hypothetical protein